MDSVISESCYKGANFTKELKENDHFMVIFLLFFCKTQWYKQGDHVLSKSVCLFDLILYVSVNIFSVMSGQVFLG